jgi:DNA-binding beta-propeller fold protein YncE
MRRALCAGLLAFAAWGAPPNYVLDKEWGGFGGGPGQFRFPAMIAVDADSNVYVVDQHNHRVQKFDSAGRFLTSCGEKGAGPGQFDYPFGIAVNSRGEVYVSDTGNHRIQQFTAEGKFIRAAGAYGSGDGQFKHPYGLAVDARDVLYAIDTLNARVQKFDRELKFLGAWGSAETIGFKVYMPHEIAVLPGGGVALSDRQNHRISVFTPEGRVVRRFGDYGEGAAVAGGAFSEPHGIAATLDGALFVCDRYNFRIQRFSAGGAFESLWKTAGTGDESERYPLGIAVNRNGDVYVTDHYRHQIQKYRIQPNGLGVQSGSVPRGNGPR